MQRPAPKKDCPVKIEHPDLNQFVSTSGRQLAMEIPTTTSINPRKLKTVNGSERTTAPAIAATRGLNPMLNETRVDSICPSAQLKRKIGKAPPIDPRINMVTQISLGGTENSSWPEHTKATNIASHPQNMNQVVAYSLLYLFR